MKLLVCDRISLRGLDLLKDRKDIKVVFKPDLDFDQLLDEVRDTEALIVRSRTKITREVIEAATQLKVIGRAGTGVDNIDVLAATQKGVLVMTTPRANSVSAAEHAFALLISLARGITQAHFSLKAGEWDKSNFVGKELQGKTLGILGLGQIGSLLAKRACAFDMKLIAYDPFVSKHYASEHNVTLEHLNSVFKKSDFLSLHLPLNKKTKGIVCKKTLTLMKNSSFLINTARGGLILESDLLDQLENDLLAGAALDVFEQEPILSSRMRENNRLLLTPHIAGSTVEAQDKAGETIATQVIEYLDKATIVNAVNFFGLTPPESRKLDSFMELAFNLGSFSAQIFDMPLKKVRIRYFGDLSNLDYRPITNHILRSVLDPLLAQPVNEINARTYAEERKIEVVETVSTENQEQTTLISIQLLNSKQSVLVEGSIFEKKKLWLVSIDGIPLQTPLKKFVPFIRNQDKPGVVGNVGTILGENKINIASFVLGRQDNTDKAIGLINTDNLIPEHLMAKIREIPTISYARLVKL